MRTTMKVQLMGNKRGLFANIYALIFYYLPCFLLMETTSLHSPTTFNMGK